MQVLIVSTNSSFCNRIKKLLELRSISVDIVEDGQDGYHYVRSDFYDIAIIDSILPSLSGPAIIEQVQKDSIKTHLILLLKKNDSASLQTLKLTDKQYFYHPIDIENLMRQIQEIIELRDLYRSAEVLSIGDLSFNTTSHQLYNDGNGVHLTDLEATLLMVLHSQTGQIVSKEIIQTKLWNTTSKDKDNNVEVCIAYLRKKLRVVSEVVTIKTVRNKGYLLKVKPKEEFY